jgi:ABC-type glutathione transport system ATPase component
MTILIRKYYNQADGSELRRNWLQKENQKRKLREESQRLDQNQDQSLNPNQNLKERKNLSVDMQLVFLEEQKL